MKTKYKVLYEALKQGILPLKFSILDCYKEYYCPNEKFDIDNLDLFDFLDFASMFVDAFEKDNLESNDES